jgi:hypothetical protein
MHQQDGFVKSFIPHGELASSKYCLAKPGSEYLVYVPAGSVVVDLSKAMGDLAVEWHNPANGKTAIGDTVLGGKRRGFKAPFKGDAVLYLVRVSLRTSY